MRVVLTCPYSMSSPGGVQSHVRGLAGELRARGVDAHVLAPAGRGPAPGVHVVGRPLPVRDNGSVVPVALSPAAAARAIGLIRRLAPDVVHLHEPMIPSFNLAILAARPAPLVGTFHRYADELGWYRLFGPLCRAALPRLDARVAVSEAARAHVARVCPGQYEVVPNGIVAGPEPDPREDGRGPGRVVFIGRPEPRKGLPVLMDAFARLPGAPTLDLVGVSAARLAEIAPVPPSAAGRVRAHGRVDDARRDALLRRADVLCAPATGGESFGIVIAEAMAAGVPVVASRVAGYEGLVGDDAGVLVPPGDAAATAAALRRVLDDPVLRRRLGARARERARALDWGVVAARLLDVYAAARERHGARSGGRLLRRRWIRPDEERTSA